MKNVILTQILYTNTTHVFTVHYSSFFFLPKFAPSHSPFSPSHHVPPPPPSLTLPTPPQLPSSASLSSSKSDQINLFSPPIPSPTLPPPPSSVLRLSLWSPICTVHVAVCGCSSHLGVSSPKME
ncbi:hypothetical protein QL285_044812 [Trifolium repens]|nr:hypothetical protein QL285_044812 [Trifolium repens]